jgi:hypothetical protein
LLIIHRKPSRNWYSSVAHSSLRHSVQSMINLQSSPIVKPRPTVLQAPY